MEVSNSDIELIKKLKQISKNIVVAENILCTLECSNLKNSSKYQIILKKLEQLINEENKIYESIQNNHLEIKELIDYISNNENLYNLTSQMYILIKNIDEKIVLCRIIMRLRELDLNINISEFEELEKLPVFNLSQNKITNNSKLGILMVDLQIRKDIVNTILFLIEKTLKETNNIDKKLYLTRIKYHINSMYKFTEEDLLNQNLDINDKLYWLADNISYYYKIDKTLYDAYKNEIIANLGTFATYYFNDLDYNSFENSNYLIVAEFYKIILRTVNMFNPLSVTKKLKHVAEKIMVAKQLQGISCEGEKIIIDIIDYAKNDCKLPKSIIIKIRKKES